jgi:hypothetical protein
MHYLRLARGFDLKSPEFLSVESGRHADWISPKCKVDICPNVSRRHGYCDMHSQRAKAGMDVNSARFRDPAQIKSYWLFQVKYPTMMFESKQIACHIHVAQLALGRKLRIGEWVHHINGDKTNYKNDNLLILHEWYHREYFTHLHPWLV